MGIADDSNVKKPHGISLSRAIVRNTSSVGKMAADFGGKKRRTGDDESSDSDTSESEQQSDESQQDEEMEDEELGENDREIQVDFEGQNPCEEDFNGIKSLLNQLLLKAHVDQSKLADLIIKQSHIGSVLKQCLDDENPDSDDDETDEVYGISTIINLTHHQNEECVKQLQQHLVTKSDGKLDAIFKNPKNQVAFLLNERFINIPPQVSVPLMENLSTEMDQANKKGEPFNFTHMILISKLHEASKAGQHASKKIKGGNLLWVNAEEESIAEVYFTS